MLSLCLRLLLVDLDHIQVATQRVGALEIEEHSDLAFFLGALAKRHETSSRQVTISGLFILQFIIVVACKSVLTRLYYLTHSAIRFCTTGAKLNSNCHSGAKSSSDST